jgi:anaerobic magnesium-protoporphyrin IX monomethyl ester cyclase
MIALFNPTSARWKFRFPLAIMHVGAFLEGKYPYQIFDENIDNQALEKIEVLTARGGLKYLGISVMPGPQLLRSIPISKRLKSRFPNLTIIWGGYFPSLHATTVLQSTYVDYVVRGPGHETFLELIDTLEQKGTKGLAAIRGLSYREDGRVVHNSFREVSDPNSLPPLPYDKIDGSKYIGKTYLGSRTGAYYSSFGCPFLCGFCAVAAIYQSRWLARSAVAIVDDLEMLKVRYGVNGMEFFDENFFTSEKRTNEFAVKMIGRDISWWGEGRPDTVLDYGDDTLEAMRRSGCKMIFFGAESASEQVLESMNKGGTQSPDTVLLLAERLRRFEIVPEFSFVFGSPGQDVDDEIDRNISFIRKIKQLNPAAEIIFYLYAPVVFEESELFQIAKENGFKFPETLDDWMTPDWQNFDLRKSPVIPWLKARHYRRIHRFERVMHGYSPTITDHKLTETKRKLLRFVSGWRYKRSIYTSPIEIRVLQRLFHYRQPELEGL